MIREDLARAYRSIPGWLKTTLGTSVLAAVILAYGAWTVSLGQDAIEKIARDRGLCTIQGCPDGFDFVEGVLTQKYDISATTLEWCLGVDEWRRHRVHRGGLVKSILVDFMDMPCGALKSPKTEIEG